MRVRHPQILLLLSLCLASLPASGQIATPSELTPAFLREPEPRQTNPVDIPDPVTGTGRLSITIESFGGETRNESRSLPTGSNSGLAKSGSHLSTMTLTRSSAKETAGFSIFPRSKCRPATILSPSDYILPAPCMVARSLTSRLFRWAYTQTKPVGCTKKCHFFIGKP